MNDEPNNRPTSLCWIRVLPRTKLNTAFLPELDKAYKKTVSVRTHGQIPPAVFADGTRGATGSGEGTFWLTDSHFAGDPKADTVFDLGKAFATHDEAEQWISGDDGKRWAAEAANYFLLSTWPEKEFEKLDRRPASKGPSAGKFPDNQWREAFAHLHESVPALELFEPAQFTVAAPEDAETECVALQRLVDPTIRTDERKAEIAAQAQSAMHAIQPVFDVLGIDLNQPPAEAAKAVVSIVDQNITRTVFHFKDQFNRARPWNECSAISPLWDEKDRLYPGHASYPSGHATAAYAWAYYLAGHFPDQQDALLTAAKRVAKNREIAGVHFPSDTEAGKELGRQMADRMVEAEQASKISLQAVVSLGRSTG